jgi:hypothetical protein
VGILFTHKECCLSFERANPLPPGTSWLADELRVFPVYLANNLQIDLPEAEAWVEALG